MISKTISILYLRSLTLFQLFVGNVCAISSLKNCANIADKSIAALLVVQTHFSQIGL